MVWPFNSAKEEEPPAPPKTANKKICCACPDTKNRRDECVATYGPESERCAELIEAHKQCLRSEGFKVLARLLLPIDQMRQKQEALKLGHWHADLRQVEGRMSRARRTPLSAQDKSKWREKVREECMQRVNQHRQDVLWRMRQEGSGLQEADVHSVLAGIIADVSSTSAAQESPEAALLGTIVANGASAASMEEDDNWLSKLSTPQPASADPSAWLSRRSNNSNEELQLDEADYMQLMADMEQSFLDAMLQDEAAFLSHFEAQELNSLVAMHEESHSSSGGVQCPLCRSNDLVERNGVVLCPAGDLRLDLRNEGLNLDHVRQRLAAAFEGHGQQGCPGRPSFSMESLAPGASPTLVMRCNGCACVYVVV